MQVAEQPRQKTWLTAGAWLLLIGGLWATYRHVFAEMWIRWFPRWDHYQDTLYMRITGGESYYTHGPLVPIVSLLITILLIRHTSIPVRPRRALGATVLIGSLLVHLGGCLARVNFVSGFSLIGVLAGLILLLWGAAALRRLWFPLAMLLFMVPLPEVTISQVNFRLKMLAADSGVGLASLCGVIVERSGNQVFLEGDKQLVIANVCNGLRTLISLLAFGALYAYVCRLRGIWRIGLFALAIPVAVVSNSLRILSLIVVADIWDVETATGWYHDTSGVLIFVMAFLLMFGLEKLILGARAAIGRPAQILPLFDGALRKPQDEDQWARMIQAGGTRAGWVAAMLVLLSVAGVWWLGRAIPSMWHQKMAQQAIPATLEIAGRQWSGADLELDEETLTILETRDYLYRHYVSAGISPVYFTVIFSQDNRKGTHPPELCIGGRGDNLVSTKDVLVRDVSGRGSMTCRELISRLGRQQQYFLYVYKCGDTYTPSFWSQQFTILVNGLLSRNASGALIRVSTTVDTSLSAERQLPEARQRAMQFMAAAIPYLDKSLP